MAGAVSRLADLRPNQRPIDPDVKVPEAVKRAAAAAEAAHAANYGQQDAPPVSTPDGNNPDTIQIAEPSATPPTPPQPQPVPPQPVTPQGNEPPPTPPQPQPPAPPSTPAEFETELQRVRSAEGRKRAQLEQQLGNAADRIAILEQMVQELQQTRTASPPPAPAAPPPQLITPEERDNFGPEMLDVVGRRAQEAISPQLAELRAMMDTLKQEVTGTVQTVKQTTRQGMLAALDQALPDWRQINVTPEFKAWLALPDPYFGVSRHSALLTAFEKNDTPRVLNFFKGFVSDLAAQAPAEPPATVQPPAPAAPAKPSLETLAAPGRARTSAQPNAPTEKQIITTADINAFYTAVRQGYYRGREAEKIALEQELFAAQREGRVKQV